MKKVDFDWAVSEASRKRKRFFQVEFLTYEEGLCVQCMHIGPIDNEPATIQLMHEYEKRRMSLILQRFHHEIYLSDARKVAQKVKNCYKTSYKKGMNLEFA